MADYEIPPDLLQKRVDFVAAQKRLSALGRVMPSAAAVAALEAEPATEEQREAWLTLQGECRRLAVEIQEHPYWREVDDPKAARKALEDAVVNSE
ncbi:hypothetical protein ACQP2T_63525 (plasmid) [Nonomuraea sp. CA-143628]|uniref:hypothetical protein n=1 Tax=Nonomuraea sp. CA-143628 TaxID=3239997 RepID=UPI003D8ACF8C